MRVPQFRLRTLMISVAIVALFLPPAIWFWKDYWNLIAYFEWAGDTSPNRPATYHLPYPESPEGQGR